MGLRKVTRNCEISRVLDFLSAGRCKCCNDWKNRFKENSEKMRVGGLLEVSEVLKTLLVQQKDKPLSFREKKMLDRARNLLITEVSISRAVSLAQACEILRKALGKATLVLPEPL